MTRMERVIDVASIGLVAVALFYGFFLAIRHYLA